MCYFPSILSKKRNSTLTPHKPDIQGYGQPNKNSWVSSDVRLSWSKRPILVISLLFLVILASCLKNSKTQKLTSLLIFLGSVWKKHKHSWGYCLEYCYWYFAITGNPKTPKLKQKWHFSFYSFTRLCDTGFFCHHTHSEFRFPDSGFPVPDSGFPVPDSGF